ncbi:MAG: hypothetical protein ACREDR_19975, partial [Blastocatellia bacterium]
LRVHELVLPPLRERSEDIPDLVDHFLKLFKQQGKRVHFVGSAVLEALMTFNWPGNIRQLKNVLESSVFLAELHGHDQVEFDDLPLDLDADGIIDETESLGIVAKGASIHEALARTELSLVEEALAESGGKKSEVWKLLGFNDRFVLHRRVRRILARFPHLSEEYPGIRRNFAKVAQGSDATD